MAENTLVSIEGTWDIEDDRSISFAPQLSIDEQKHLYLFRKGIK